MKIKVKSKNLLFYSRLLFNFLSFGNDFLIEYNLFKQSIQKVKTFNTVWIEFQYNSLIMLCLLRLTSFEVCQLLFSIISFWTTNDCNIH